MNNQVFDRDAILAPRATAIAAPHEREAFIAEACGNDRALKEEVTRVMATHFNSSSAHNGTSESAAPAGRRDGEQGAAERAAAERAAAGTLIGPFKVVVPLGEGERGVVYLADQEQPVRRKVALKVFKAGTDAQAVLERYESERRALAVLDHPNIAKVLQVGTVPAPSEQEAAAGDQAPPFAGRCYVAMEPVKGMPITRFCDEKRLSIERRLELFVAVCQAVQHAHHKGVLHGNLKPSNVLVTGSADHPIPRVTEIGVARPAGQDLEYLSPEQAQQGALDVDGRSDVYALGVLLYELLTGTTPLPRERLLEAEPTEALRLIRDVPPPLPSQYLRAATERLAALAAERQTDPTALIAAVRGELDSVVMYALQKDRARRYETPGALARDVQRFLSGQPVEAHPPSPVYELRKLARRYRRAAMVASVGLVLAVTAGVVGIALAWWATRAQDEAQGAVQDAVAKRDEAVNADKALKDQLEDVVAAQKSTTSALEQALADAARAKHAAADERAVLSFLQDKVLSAGRAKEFFEGGEFDKNVTLRKALDAAEPKIAITFGGRPLALALARELFGSAYLDLGDPAQAVKEYKQALALRQKAQGPQHADTVACRTNLARALRLAGRPEAASELYQQKSEPPGKQR